jgi:hypothetical protein
MEYEYKDMEGISLTMENLGSPTDIKLKITILNSNVITLSRQDIPVLIDNLKMVYKQYMQGTREGSDE